VAKKRILYVCHNHPLVRPGGAEAYALELYHGMRASDEFEPVFVARVGRNRKAPTPIHAGAPFSTVGTDPNQYFVFVEDEAFDFFWRTARDKSLYTTYFDDFLRSFRPDIVHFQHSHFIGCELITKTRQLLPEVPILYTLHEYLAICNRDGQMVRTKNEELCLEESPRRCNECYPEWSPQNFFLRKRFIQSHFAHVDRFLAPSRFLRDRYVDWGIPPERIVFEDYGRMPPHRIPAPPREEGPRTRIAFFGQVNRYKGVKVLLEAMALLAEERPDVHLWLHGANLEVETDAFQAEIRELLDATRDVVTFTGPYAHESLPAIMSRSDWVVVPSTWWENSPLVIQEAFMHGRPVICSGIGGMAEKVTDGVNGLHFNVGDPRSLADAIKRAVGTPGLWDQLRAGIPEVYGMGEHLGSVMAMYRELMDARRAETPRVPELAPA
jgi:glycosyltransferase involved in cell wall biosynthesis